MSNNPKIECEQIDPENPQGHEHRLITDLTMKIVEDLEKESRRRSTQFEHLPDHITLSIYSSVASSLPLRVITEHLQRMKRADNMEFAKLWLDDVENRLNMIREEYGL